MKKSGGDRLKRAIYGSTLSTAGAVPLPRWGRQKGGSFAALLEEILFKYVFSCAFINDSGNLLNDNIKMIHDLKVGIADNQKTKLL